MKHISHQSHKMEIEIKAKFTDKEKIKIKLAELGAEKEKEKHQIDEYYNHPSKDTKQTNEYIRLRYKHGGEQGIFAHHINISDGVNKEFEVKIDDVDTFKQILKNFDFPLLGTIDKKRETFKVNDFTITIDEVKNIGNFIEIETFGEEDEIEAKKTKCLELLETLGIPKENQCNIWLCDIATGKSKL